MSYDDLTLVLLTPKAPREEDMSHTLKALILNYVITPIIELRLAQSQPPAHRHTHRRTDAAKRTMHSVARLLT